jgi:hypothetical protein
MTETWSWAALAGLGAFHGLNPGMGWLFAVALGLHRGERRIVWLAAFPIALGHALAVGIVATAFVWAGLAVDGRSLRLVAGAILIGWALYLWRYGHRGRVRFGMTAGLAGLGVWSFLMATGHGAGLMLWPALAPLCLSASASGDGPATAALIGLAIHTATLLLVTASVALAVYHWVGLEVLRRAWLNVDLVWRWALAGAGALLLIA